MSVIVFGCHDNTDNQLHKRTHTHTHTLYHTAHSLTKFVQIFPSADVKCYDKSNENPGLECGSVAMTTIVVFLCVFLSVCTMYSCVVMCSQ